MIKKIEDIKQIPSDMTTSELQTVVVCHWLKRGFNSFLGGDKLAEWLENHTEEVEQAFGADDRVYIRMKTKESNAKLTQFVIEENIGDEVQWKKCKDSDRWWLYIWWD